ncbi:MAG: dipeptidyl aminopeptidase, partial [Verrucomicrobiae bacterium]|nr:dipeptidyl aminopeptidase [Verrucomicrobiae bacterium]
MRAIFYDALPYEGSPTRVFAYLAVPEVSAGKKLPAMVLVHGGGGTAFHEWAKIWYDKGYAAIAMDLEG